MSAQFPSPGRVIQVNIHTKERPVWRPALVTVGHSEECCQATVILDAYNDRGPAKYPALEGLLEVVPGALYAGSSLCLGEDSLNWRWPPRV